MRRGKSAWVIGVFNCGLIDFVGFKNGGIEIESSIGWYWGGINAEE